jgi:hypothetical protein
MHFFKNFIINLVLTMSSGSKRHAVAFTTSIFAGFCVYHTDLSKGRGRQIGQACTTEQVSVYRKNTAVYWQLLASQTSKRFLPEVENVAFCILFIKSVKK